MTPAYLLDLADIADPDQLWRLPGMQQLELPPEKRRQLDAGVALRRHARDVERLDGLRGKGKSLLLTPLPLHGTAVATIATPRQHTLLLKRCK